MARLSNGFKETFWVTTSLPHTKIESRNCSTKHIKLEGHSVECMPPSRNVWCILRTYQVQYIFEISCNISFLALSLNGEESLCKLSNTRMQIQIRIFTKIESILSCHTPNTSTKYRPNPSTTFWDIMLFIVFLALSQWWRISFKILVVSKIVEKWVK